MADREERIRMTNSALALAVVAAATTGGVTTASGGDDPAVLADRWCC